MLQPDMVVLYVENPAASAAFYVKLLNLQPIETAPTFVLFVLESGMRLGLMSKHTVEPAPTALGCGVELGFNASDDDHLHTLHADWKKQGLDIILAPKAMHWGLTFIALDPDGYRLRVFVPAEKE